MTKERGQDLVFITIVLSVAIHVGLMFYARTKVMTHVDRSALRDRHREAMRVEDYRPIDDPVAIERIKDIMSAREAPEAEATDAPAPVTEQLPDSARKHWDGDVPAPEAPESDAVPVTPDEFDVQPIRLDEGVALDPIPTSRCQSPSVRPRR